MKIFLPIALLLLLATATSTQAQTYSGGAGTAANPYQIANFTDLQYLSEHPSNWANHYTQTADIDADTTLNLNGGAGFSPIGNATTPFTGAYNGQGFKIHKFTINRPTQNYIGLFGYCSAAVLANIVFGKVPGGYPNEISGYDFTGGLVGYCTGGSISNCYVQNFAKIGGLNYVGVLVGENNGGLISNCCAVYAPVIGDVINSENIGGLVGNNSGTISTCYVTSFGNAIIGKMNVGGLVGNNSGTISTCYAAIPIFTLGGSSGGGLVGFFGGGSISNSFYDTNVSGKSDNDGRGVPKTTAEMKTQSTFTTAGWDFSTIWKMGSECTNRGYPVFMAQPLVYYPTIVSTTGAARFCPGSVVLSAIASDTNAIINWFITNLNNGSTGVGSNIFTTPSISSTTTYYVKALYATGYNCQSQTLTAVTATINALPAPTGTAAQTFCTGATVANLAATGTAIQWYATPTGGTALPSSTALVNTTIYYASQTSSSCESDTRFAVTATINTTPSPTGAATQSFCSATIANLTATGTGIQWYDSAIGGSLYASTDTLVSGNHYYASQTIGGCASARLDVLAIINPAPTVNAGANAISNCTGTLMPITAIASTAPITSTGFVNAYAPANWALVNNSIATGSVSNNAPYTITVTSSNSSTNTQAVSTYATLFTNNAIVSFD
jgi:hypothetical protein